MSESWEEARKEFYNRRILREHFNVEQEDLPPPKKVFIVRRTSYHRDLGAALSNVVQDQRLEIERLRDIRAQKDWAIQVLLYLCWQNKVTHPWVRASDESGFRG